MMEDILEQVEVGAVFGKNRIKPRWFIWKNRKYPVEKISYIWHDTNGDELVYYFSVVASANLYELSFYTRKLKWMLDRIYVEG
ncbi:MAG TPA: hypothetical protein PKN36_11005 [bacterium]|nr:hypothetical protein [bacterium]